MEKFELDYEDIEIFITQVFNYYNGRINKIIPATLNIDFINKGTIAGEAFCTGLVNINPLSTYIYADFDSIGEFKLELLLVVIHELFHVDQYINSYYYTNNEQYHCMIENAVIYQTYAYTLNHINEVISFIPDISLNIDYFVNVLKEKMHSNMTYHRLNYADYITLIINWCLGLDSIDMKNMLNKYFNIKDSSIILSINNNKFIIRANGINSPIPSFQQFMYGINNYKYFINEDCFFDYDSKILNIIIIKKQYNILADRVDKKE